MIKKPEKENWIDFMDRARANGVSPSTQEIIDKKKQGEPKTDGQKLVEFCDKMMGCKP